LPRSSREALAETDFLVALLNREDPLHENSLRACERMRVVLSPYSLVELDLLILSRKIETDDEAEFLRDVARELRIRRVSVANVRPEAHSRAAELRADGMGYFDSLHRALAELIGIPILSADRSYSKCESGWIDLRSV